MGYGQCSACDCVGFKERSRDWNCRDCGHHFKAHYGPEDQKEGGDYGECTLEKCDCSGFKERRADWLCEECEHAFSVHGEKRERDDDSSSSCFPATAGVLTPDGKRGIAAFSRGDAVLSFDLLQEKLVERAVTKTREYRPSRIWKVEFAIGREALRVTSHHTLLTQRGWVRVGNLNTGDYLIGIGESNFRIERVFPTSEVEKVYNLITSGEHNFIVEGIVAHNFTFLREARYLLHRALFDPFRTKPIFPEPSPI